MAIWGFPCPGNLTHGLVAPSFVQLSPPLQPSEGGLWFQTVIPVSKNSQTDGMEHLITGLSLNSTLTVSYRGLLLESFSSVSGLLWTIVRYKGKKSLLREEPISQSKAGSLPPFLLSAFRVLELLTGSEAQFIIVKARAWQFPAGAESSTSSSEG